MSAIRNTFNARQREAERMFLKHSYNIRRFVYSMMPGSADADDVFQEVFLTVIDKYEQYQPGTNFLTWVYMIAKFKVLEHQRWSRRVNTLSAEAMEALIQEREAIGTDEHERERLLRRLEFCLSQLAPRLRQLIGLRYHDGLRAQSIAATCGVTRESVNVMLTRARKALHACLKGAEQRPETEA